MTRAAAAIWAIILVTALSPARLPAQTSQPASHPAPLEAFDAQVQQLYRQAQANIVRVQVPVRVSVDHPLVKWRMQLDPELRRQLESVRSRGDAPRIFVEPPASQQVHSSAEANRIPLPPPAAMINVEYVGLVLNRQGDVLLPLFIDRAYLEGPLQVTVDERQATTAVVSASDRQTSLSIVRLAQPAGEPVRFASERPAMGALVLMLSPTRRAARLALWTGGQDDNAILVNRGGDFAGIVRNGHPMFPSTFMPVVEQLLATGTVQRAQLGVRISEVRSDDPQRVQLPALGSRPAARVADVLPDSAAARAGLQQGDLILSLGGELVEDVPTFAAGLAHRRGRTEILLLRDGRELTLVIDLQVQ